MANEGSGEGRPRLFAVPDLPADEAGSDLRTDGELREALAADSEQLRMRAALEADPATAAMREAFGLGER